jgi:AAA+ ATPase superfamily predicted ATPase
VIHLASKFKRVFFWKSELDDILQKVKSGRSIIIVGREHSGKSTVLKELASQLKGSFLFSSSAAYSVESYVKDNLANVLSSAGLENIPDSLIMLDSYLTSQKMGDDAKMRIRKLVYFIRGEHDEGFDPIAELYSLPKALSGKAAVLLIDDIGEFKVPEGVLFVSASQKKIPGTDSVQLKSLGVERLRSIFKESSVSVSEEALNEIFNKTGGLPFYIDLVSKRLRHESDCAAVISEILEDNSMLYIEELKQLSRKELPIIYCMAKHDANTPSRIAALIKYSQTGTRRFLSIMEEKGFVELKDRGVFEMCDPMLKGWLGGAK